METLKLAKVAWTEELLRQIDATLFSEADYDAAAFVRDGVCSGRFEMWRLQNGSLAVTETIDDTMRVHCYQGHDVRGFAFFFQLIARQSGCKRAQFQTHHESLVRLLRPFKPRRIAPCEYEVIL